MLFGGFHGRASRGNLLAQQPLDAVDHQLPSQGGGLLPGIARQGLDHLVGFLTKTNGDRAVADVLGIVVHGSSTEEV